jgi:hypothetical protein
MISGEALLTRLNQQLIIKSFKKASNAKNSSCMGKLSRRRDYNSVKRKLLGHI